MGRLTGQTALVTGASSGIGFDIATVLAQEGAAVAINYRSHGEEAEKLSAEIKASGGQAIALQADVSDEGAVQQLFRATVDAFERLDILVANSGIQKDAPIGSMTLDDWRKVIDVNLTGQFLCAREAVAIFRRQGIDPGRSRSAGKIVCMSSVHEVIPWAGHVNYAASKGGIMLFMKSLAQEVAPERIRVNSVAPGAIRTPINKDAWDSDEALEKLLTLIPYGRIGEPEDVAKACCFLVSDDADYITGTTLFVDGGMTLYPGFADNG